MSVQDFSVIAGLYSQLAGVLAGFAFAGMIALFSAQFSTHHHSKAALIAAIPLASTLFGLIAASLNYAIVAGEKSRSDTASALETSAGSGFSIAGIMLFYSLLILVRGIESLSGDPRTARRLASVLQSIVILMVGPLLTLLMFGGSSDHLIITYGDAWRTQGLTYAAGGLEVVAMGSALLIWFRYRKRRGLVSVRLGNVVSISAISICALSLIGTSVIQIFAGESWQQSDLLPLTEMVCVTAFSILTSYSAATFRSSEDDRDGTALAWPDSTTEVSVMESWSTRSFVSPPSDLNVGGAKGLLLRPGVGPTPLKSKSGQLVSPRQSKVASSIGSSGAARAQSLSSSDDQRDDLVQELDRESLKARARETFPAAYLTLVSIVQGLALALCVQNLPDKAMTSEPGSRTLLLLETSASALAIVVVFYMYVWFTLVARWAPSALDTIIPFLLGALQAGLVLTIGQTTGWLEWLAALQVGAALAFGHSFIRISAEMFMETKAFLAVRRLLSILIAMMLAGAIGTFSASAAVTDPTALRRLTTIIGGFYVLVGVTCMIISDLTLSQVFRMHHLRWWRPLRAQE